MFRKINKIIFAIRNKILLQCMRYNAWPAIEHYETLKKINFDTLIDIGANKGQFSKLVQILNPDCNVYSFEPVSRALSSFKNFCHNENFHSFNHAVGSKSDEKNIIVSRSHDNSSFLAPTLEQDKLSGGKSRFKYLEKSTIRMLDDSNINISGNSLLKIDVQGYELEVLMGAQKTLKSIKYLIIEVSRHRLYEGQSIEDEIIAFLEERKFTKLYRYNDNPNSQSDILFINSDRYE